MCITNRMRLERAMEHLEAERAREEHAIQQLDGIKIQEIIILRNKKAMYMAEVDQLIRNTKEKIEQEKEKETK
ncbi:MAG: hypothetical protein IJ153_11485 [Clostridia bacterium]|nr:hypothetical protein [Clostridia bacterium]MBQ9212309.1 hypothetical protein [Clostridia bacterium]